MQLTDEQKKAVTQWVTEGVGISEIQRRLLSELKISMTYMDVRFLLIELKLNVKEKPTPPASAAAADLRNLGAAPGADKQPLGGKAAPAGGGAGGVSLDVDRVTAPGFIVSGTVRFSDGVTARWMLDQTGRLALKAPKPDYRPSEADVQQFQMLLSEKLQAQGY